MRPRLCRLAISGVCFLSLLVGAASVWLWYRSHHAARNQLSFRLTTDRYTFRSEPGRFTLTGPPRGVSGEESAGALVRGWRNDQYQFGVAARWNRDGHVFSSFMPRPAEGSPAESLVVRGFRAKLAHRPNIDPDLVRPLLRALDEPNQAAAAHLILLQQSSASQHTRFITIGPDSMPAVQRTDDELFVDVQGLTLGIRTKIGWR